MNFIIDGHEDLAFEALANQRDTTRSVAEIRGKEPQNTENQVTLGWPEMQVGKVGIIFATIFIEPPAHHTPPKRLGVNYDTPDEFHQSVRKQLVFYEQWEDSCPDKFTIIRSLSDLDQTVSRWQREVENPSGSTLPIGLVLLLEGAEGLRKEDDLDEYYDRGLRIVGPVWEGGRWCGGTYSPDSMRFTPEGKRFLEILSSKGFILDVAHMNTFSADEALDLYEGTVIASHCNCRRLLRSPENQRHFDDETIRKLIDRDGVMGVIPFNNFLDTDWKNGMPRNRVTLDLLAQHIDHICQLAGNADHAAIGSDLDGGFGYPNIPEEMNDIQDLQKLEQILQRKGYTPQDIMKIFNGNWIRVLKRGLP